MSKYWAAWVGCALVWSAFGEDPAWQKRAAMLEALGAEDSPTRVEARLALIDTASTDLAGVLRQVYETMRSSSDPEVARQIQDVIRGIYRRHELGLGAAECGWTLGWFLHHDGENLRSLPLVVEVVEGGPADQAGVKPGDAIAKLDGRSLRSSHSRNEFVREVSTMRPGREMTLEIWRGPSEGAFRSDNKSRRKELVVVPAEREPTEEEEPIDDATVGIWLRRILE